MVCKGPFITSEWHGWMLVYLTNQCFNTASQYRQNRKDPFKYKYISSVERILEKVDHPTYTDLQYYLNGFSEIHYCELEADNDELHITFDGLNDIKIIVVDQISHEQSNDMFEIIHIDNSQFQLRTIIGSRLLGNNANWHGHIYSRHGRSFTGWWFNDSDMHIPIQLDNLPEILPYNDNYTCVYVRTENDDIDTLRDKFLESLGGQSHVQCSKHILPLVASSTRSNKCQCGKTEFYRCCELSCNTFICKKRV